MVTWNHWVMMTFPLFVPTSKRWLGWQKTENPDRDRLGRFCDIYYTVILWYYFKLRVVSDILWYSCFESMEWTKRHPLSADEVIRCVYYYNCVYMLTLEEFASHKFLNPWLETICQTLFFFLRNKTRSKNKQDEWNKSTASLSLAEQWSGLILVKLLSLKLICWKLMKI